MTEVPSTSQERGPVIPVRPQPNIYTVLLLIAIIALGVAVGVAIWRLTATMPTGYGLELKHIFKPGSPLPGLK